jgi:protein-export membrane protein SecD
MLSRSLLWYAIVGLVSLFVVLFVGKSVDDEWNAWWTITAQWLSSFRKWMDIAWWVRLMYKIDLSTYNQVYTDPLELSQVVNNVTKIILKNIDTRISWLGVSDYNSYIQTLSDGEYVVVEIGWVSDLDEAKKIIGKTVELEFKIEYTGNGSDVQASRQQLAEELLRQTVANPLLFEQIAQWKESNNVFYTKHTAATRETLPVIFSESLLNSLQSWRVHPVLLQGIYDETVLPPAIIGTWAQGVSQTLTRQWWTVIKLNSVWQNLSWNTIYDIEEIFIDALPQWIVAKDPTTNEILNGGYFQYASVSQSQLWQPVTVINFNDTWKEVFCNITKAIVGKPLGIFIDGQLITAPTIREPICGWSAQIDGQFDMASARALVEELNSWALPAQLILSNEEKVAPTLWDRAAVASVYIWLVSLLVVAWSMIIMYWWKKALWAFCSLIIFFLVLWALIKVMGYALSLSWIAAILLSIGMWVDANILLYERFIEERKAWSSPRQAVLTAYERSWPAIRDGNITAVIIGMLMFFMGTNVFKWFGTMMIVTVLLTLFVITPLAKEFLLLFYWWIHGNNGVHTQHWKRGPKNK